MDIRGKIIAVAAAVIILGIVLNKALTHRKICLTIQDVDGKIYLLENQEPGPKYRGPAKMWSSSHNFRLVTPTYPNRKQTFSPKPGSIKATLLGGHYEIHIYDEKDQVIKKWEFEVERFRELNDSEKALLPDP